MVTLLDLIAKFKKIGFHMDSAELDGHELEKLLVVLGCFQKGDSDILELILDYLKHFKPDGYLKDKGGITTKQGIDCMKRLAEATRLMEADDHANL
jgi:hypothetical protein